MAGIHSSPKRSVWKCSTQGKTAPPNGILASHTQATSPNKKNEANSAQVRSLQRQHEDLNASPSAHVKHKQQAPWITCARQNNKHRQWTNGRRVQREEQARRQSKSVHHSKMCDAQDTMQTRNAWEWTYEEHRNITVGAGQRETRSRTTKPSTTELRRRPTKNASVCTVTWVTPKTQERKLERCKWKENLKATRGVRKIVGLPPRTHYD